MVSKADYNNLFSINPNGYKEMLSFSQVKTCFLCRLCCALLLTGVPLLTCNAASAEAAKSIIGKQAEWGPSVTVTLENISISKAAVLIGEQTGYRISLDGLAPDLPVTGRFSESDLTTVFTNLLRDYNLGILVDHSKRQVVVQSLGKKLPSRPQDTDDIHSAQTTSSENSQQDVAAQNVANFENSPDNKRDPFTGQSYSEIVTLHHQQEAEIERDQQNPEAVEPLSGMTNAEIWALHEMQKKAIADTQP